MNKTIVAIDGGATKTALTVCDAEGFELYYATSSGSNYQAIGEQNVVEVLTNLLTDAANNLHDWYIDAAIFAIAGVDTVEDLNIVQSIVERSIANSPLKIADYTVENDVEATLIGLTSNKPGALLISGTGAIAYGYDGKKLVRAGGWGHRAGDEGSGYWIGQQVARAIFKSEDGRGQKTFLTDLVLQELSFEQVDQLYNFLYNDTYTNARLASLGSLLQHACDTNDKVALLIANEAAHELYILAEAIIKQLNMSSDDFTLYLNGGVIKNNPCIYDSFLMLMTTHYPHVNIELCDKQPLHYLIERARLLMKNVNS